MPRSRVVTPDAVAETVEDVDRPFCTTKDVADRLDVTKQAIRNHHDELEQSSLLEHGKVGRQRVYWLAERDTPAQVTETETADPPEPPRHQEQHQQEKTADSEGGIIGRFFASLPSRGGPLEVWILPLLTVVIGLILGATTWMLVVQPPIQLQVAITTGLLALAAAVALPLALTHTLDYRSTDAKERERA